jgi:two-component system, LytTR family, response regulator
MPPETPRLRVLIVDDELPARRRLERLLSRAQNVELIGNCASGTEALHILETQPVDLLLLDIQMPRLDGFTLLEQLPEPPLVVFVTAYDHYAVKAFAVRAFDYLLKPYDEEQFQQVLQRAKERIGELRAGELQQQLRSLLDRPKTLRRLVIKSADRVFFLNTDEIDWVKAEAKYVRLYVGQTSHLWRGAISELEAQLDGERFIRIHRSTIVNLERVQELRPLFHGEYEVILRDGTALTLSRRYRTKLQEAIGSSL